MSKQQTVGILLVVIGLFWVGLAHKSLSIGKSMIALAQVAVALGFTVRGVIEYRKQA
jgi:hypothetical protein